MDYSNNLPTSISLPAGTSSATFTVTPLANPALQTPVLAALQSVDGVCIFTDTTATKFLAAAQPDIYVKGGDYTLETLNQDERRAVESAGGKIILVPFVPGKSTTSLLEKISRL